MMVAVFYTAFPLVRHVAIGTGNTTLSVDTHHRQFVIRMLRLQDRRFAQFMRIIGKAFCIVISFHIFHCETFIPGESQIFTIALEIIFHVALCTNQRAHFLLGRLGDIASLALESFDQSRTADLQVHCSRFVAIGTTDRIHDLVTHSSPFRLIEIIHTYGLHHAGNVRTLTSPASCRLRAFVGCHRGTDTQCMTHIVDSMHVSAGRRIVLGEGISGP